MRARLVAVLLCLAGVAHADERVRILSHGPWPPPAPRDAGKRELIALGERLFFEPRLSGTGSVLCATCHVPYRAFQDARARAFGLEEVDRNTPTLINVAFYRRYGWDGVRDSLPAQSIRPLLEPREMRSSAAHVAAFVRSRLASDYASAFGGSPPVDDGRLLADVGRALAAYQATLVSGRTPFDEFRDALERGDAAAMARYPPGAQRGLRTFVGKCSECHAGALFSNSSIVAGFRVPALRNVELTAPYMHDGSVATLAEAVRHRMDLTASESDDLVLFLRSLTEVTRSVVRQD
jgi:cytochrome c peroxidase